MQILIFRVKNHKSLRDEVALDMVEAATSTGEGDSVLPVAGIFGAPEYNRHSPQLLQPVT